jgi:ribosome-binding protein aMBF1 (putative translation factor)
MMSEREKWDEIRAGRPDSEVRRRGHQDAADSFELGSRVRSERERHGLTQVELAERMGTTQPTVARLEAGGVTPSLDTLHRIADALGLELVVEFRDVASA